MKRESDDGVSDDTTALDDYHDIIWDSALGINYPSYKDIGWEF